MSPKLNRADDQLYVHFITFSVADRRKLLDRDGTCDIVLDALVRALKQQDARCFGYVIMPDHVHALLRFSKPGQLSEFVRYWKSNSSIRIRNWLRRAAPEYVSVASESSGFWQSGFYSFEIYSEPKLVEKLDYIHANPVRARLCSHAVDWKWSSARRHYLGEDDRVVGPAS
jgi:putative transposase